MIRRFYLLLALLLVSSFSFGSDFYWIGGSGAWTDSQNWSTSSGGAAGNSVPQPSDNVIFDANSFTVTNQQIDLSGLHVNNFNWNEAVSAHNASFLNSSSVTIDGDFTLINIGDNIVSGQFVLEGTGHINIDIVSNGAKFDLWLNGQASYHLKNQLILPNNRIELSKGHLYLDEYSVYANEFIASSASQKEISISNSNVLLVESVLNTPYGTNTQWSIDQDGLIVYASQLTAVAAGANVDNNHIISSNQFKSERGGTFSCGDAGAGDIVFQFTTSEDLATWAPWGVSCRDSCDGEVSVTVDFGGVGPFDFQWVSGPNAATWSTACGGGQTVIVTDIGQGNLQCFGFANLPEPPPITVLFSNPVDPSCFGECDGQVSALAAAGTPPPVYTWNEGQPNEENTATANQLCTGLNTLLIEDGNGCQFDTTFFLNNPPQIFANMTIEDVFCNGACDGYAIANPSGGNGSPYYFEWAHDGSILIDSAGGLCPGFYDVRIYDVDSCFIDTTFEITEPTSMVVNTVSQTNLTCFGVCIGSIEVSTSNGTAPYTYEWFDAISGLPVAGQDNDEIAENLCAGDYYVVVTDDNGCTFQSNNFTITQPDEIVPTITSSDVLCFGDCTGQASVSAVGGDGNYTFTWIDDNSGATVGTGNSINTLCAGDYIVEVEDGTGCTIQSAQFTINEPAEVGISVSTVDLQCAGQCAVGSATATVTDGVGPYTVEWHSVSTGFISSGAALTINNLCADDYFAVGIDDNGCDDTVFFTINEPLPIDINPVVTDILCNSACDGSIDANASGGTGNLAYQWFTCAPVASMPGETNQVISNLCQGDYYVEVTDDNGCTVDNSAACSSLTDPPQVDISISSTSNATCGGACDGQATAATSGGTGNLTVTWFSDIDDTQQGTGNSINTLCTGTYYAVVTDDNGCEDTTNVFTINDLVVVTGNVTANDATCNGFCDGSASVVPAGSVPPYTYEWVEISTGNVILSGLSDNINGLCAGDYTVQVFDANLCSSAPIPFTISELPVIVADVTVTDATCNSDCDGSAIANASGGDGSLIFTWTPAPGAGQGTANGTQMCAGSYNLHVEDGSGCFIDTTIVINEPAPYVFTSAVTHEVCAGACDGEIQISLTSGGSGAITYTYSPAPGAGQGTSNATGLCPGNYTCTIEDANGCDSTFNFTINAAQPILVGLTLTTDNDCNGVCEGVIQANASGGTGALTYLWSPGNPTGQGTGTISDLCAGTYDVIVTDDNGCQETGSETVTEPAPFDITSSFVDATCSGSCDGEATATVNSGGTPNYFYSWDDPLNQNTPTATGLCPGTYNVTVSDQNGCDSIIPITISAPTAMNIVINSNSGACFGSCSGTADVTITGGTAGYSVEWFDATTGLSTGQTGLNATGLCPGDYFAEVTDAAGCIDVSATVTITEDPEIEATSSSTLSNCVVCDGTASVVATGGSGSYVNYTWSPAPGAGQGTANPTNMCAGVYSVLIEDSNGCTETVAVTVSDVTGETITPSSSDALCFGGCDGDATASVVCGTPACTFEWYDDLGNQIGQTGSTATALCAGDYIVEVTNGNGCIATESYTIGEGVEITATTSFTDPQCTGGQTGTATVNPSGGTGAFTFTWTPNPLGGQGTNTATGLTAGNWSVDIEDGNGCIITESFVLTDPPVLDVSNISSADISCFGLTDGTATVLPSGGVSPYTYEWFECITDVSIGQTGQQATGLGAGSYYAVVTDDNGCAQASACVDVNEPAQLSGVLSGSGTICNGDCNGSAQVVPSGGINNYDFQWFDLGGAIPGATGDVITNLCIGTYSVEITDLNGCTELISSFEVTEPTAFDVSTITNDASCFGDCDGSADITVSGGTAPYNYTWSIAPGTGDGTANGGQMCAGSYTVLIEDANGCDTTIQVTINSPAQIAFNASITNITCFGDNDGEISISPSGGNSPYQFNWLPNGETSSTITGLGPDSYTVNVQDLDGCTTDTTITLIEPTEITSSFISNNSTCGQCNGNASVSVSGGYGGYQYLWTPSGQNSQVATALCAGIYSVDVTDAGGCLQTFGVTVSDIGAETLTSSSNDASCFNTNDGDATVNFTCSDPNCSIEWFDDQGASIGQTSNNATGLGAGDYFVEVTNNSGCISFEQVTIGSPSEIFANETITPITCFGSNDGEITVSPSGGSGAGYTYLWTPAPGSGQGTPTASGLASGNYDLVVTDGTGCSESYTYTINEPTEILATASSNDILCFGQNNGSAEVSASGGSFPYTYQWQDATNTPIAGETSDIISGLAPGDYFVEVTDLTGCTTLVGPVTINEPVVLDATISTTDVLCFGDCTGTGDVVITGGVGPYTTNWFDGFGNSIGQSGTSASALCPGDYNAVVVDDNGCQFNTVNSTVTEPTELTATASGNDPTCDAVCDGDGSAVALGGTSPYQYNWLDSQGQSVSGGGGANVSGLCEDIYTVEVFDDNGCSVGPLSVTLDAPTLMTADVFVNDASCNASDGDATIVVSGGTPNYNYQWYDGAMSLIGGATSDNLGSLAAGTYFVEVTDNMGCTETFQVEVSNVNGPTITVVSVTDVLCFGETTGGADIDVTGISPPFTYVWNPSGQVGQDLEMVGEGTYTVTVTDAAGCVSNEVITINENQEIDANFTVTDATCGLCDGEIIAAGTGGTGGFTYTWSTGQTGATISSLCPGVYSVDVADASGCVVNLTTPITNVGGPTGEVITANEPSCNGGTDGDAQVSIIGGTAPYAYLWLHDGGTTDMATNIGAGTYYLEVTDDNGCSRTVEVVLGEPDALSDISDIIPATCGLCDGEVSVSGDGGVGPYTYAWNHGPTSQSLTGLCEGIYIVDITDVNGCTETFQYPVNGATAPTVTVDPSDVSCGGNCDGSITSDTTGGTQPMSYEWLDATGTPIGQTSDAATGLCIGDYILQVTDGAGCLSFAQATIDGPTGFQFSSPSVFDAQCAGSADGEAFAVVVGGTLPYTYTWTPAPGGGQGTSHATGLPQGVYTVDVTDANGCTDQQTVTIGEPLPIIVAIDTVNDALCKDSDDGFIEITASGGSGSYQYDWISDPAGFTSTDEDIYTLLPMDYIVTVTDGNGCTYTDTIPVDTLVVVVVDAGPDTSYCVGNTFEINGSASGLTGIVYNWFDDQGNLLDSDSLLTVAEGEGTYTYILEATDAAGNCSDIDTVVVTVNPLPTVSAGPDIDIILNDEATIGGSPTASSGTSVIWTPTADLSDSTTYNPIASPDTTTTYIVTGTDLNGCSNADTMTVNVFPDIVFPNGFSPNGDGVNDTWEIDFISEFPDCVVEVYNRWGELLFRSIGYVEEWDGNYNGQQLPVGTYYYVIELNNPLYPEPYDGPITILR